MDSDEEQSDQESMDGEEWKELHQAIQSGDVEYVRRVLQSEAADLRFSYERTSALYRAFSCHKYEIASYLIHRGAKAHDSELDSLDCLDLKRLNHLLLQYNRKTEKSCIYQLISWSQSPRGLEGDRLRAVISLYEEFYESPVLRLIMMVLEEKEFPIVYDFESDFVNRIHRLYEEEAEIYGLTLTKEWEIFVGAKNLLSGDSRKRAKVCGVVAEEFCHLALTILFENDAKPYRKEESELKRKFGDIVLDVQSSLNDPCHVESVIKDVYRNYEGHSWECELIARVPHVIGIYGEEKGRIVMESRELSRLFSFYMDNVHPKCREFTDPTLNTKAHRQMQQVLNKNNFISYQEKQAPPLKDGFPSFRESLEDIEGVSVMATNSAKICTLQVYHELKRELRGEHGDAWEKKCIFVSRERFEEETERILDALRGRAWKYSILVLDEEDLSLRRLTCKYLDEFEEFKGDEMKIVVISESQSLGRKFEKKRVRYKWNDLTDDFKALQEVRYLFRGEEGIAYIAKERFQELFSEEEILRIVSGSVFEVCDGKGLYSRGYSPETYIDRKFEIMTLHKEFFKHIPSNISVFLSGFSRFDLTELQIRDNVVQWISGPGVEIQEGKSIFIDDIYKPMTFREFVRKNPDRNNIWVQYDRGTFYLRCSESSDELSKRFVNLITVQEKEMLEFLKKNYIVIISDNAGYGKSTVISNLIRRTKEAFHHSWVWRIDFNEFVMPAKDRTGKENPLSLGSIHPDSDEEDVLDYFFLILGLNTGLEKHLFKDLSRYGECFVFFDGFDEIPSKYVNSALKLLSIVREETDAKMIVTTRKHHQKQLEEFLNRISHQLVPFSREDQVKFLDMYWKYNLMSGRVGGRKEFQKYQKAVARKMRKVIEEQKVGKTKSDPVFENMEDAVEKIESADSFDSVMLTIEDLDFKQFAESILDKALFDDGIVKFLGIPLHLNMVAVIYFNGNFNVEVEYDIYNLYQQFIEQKILIYIQEKEGIVKEGTIMDENVKTLTEKAYMIHMELAFQSVVHERVLLDSEWNESDPNLCPAVGIVFTHNGRIQFLHKSFAEFFVAEYVRKIPSKEVLHKIIFESEYNVVEKFLSSSLRRKNFENIEIEFFEDSEFLMNVMDARFNNFAMYDELELYIHPLKIVNKLLQKFEEIDVTKDKVNMFIDGLHGHVMRESESDCFFAIGGCLTIYMFQSLLARNFEFYSKSIPSFVRVSENVEEVLDALNEFISMNTDSLWYLRCLFDGNEAGNVEKDAAADSLYDMLTEEDSRFPSCYYDALCSRNPEMFARILKHFRDILGEEEFANGVVESVDYEFDVGMYLEIADPNSICIRFEALLFVFGNEMENLFHEDFKVSIIQVSMQYDMANRSSKSFERAISLFQKCFGTEKLKKFLLGCNQEGEFLIHTAMYLISESIFSKHMQIASGVLDEAEMKQFLMYTDSDSRNAFHLAVQCKKDLKYFLQFYKDRFEMKEIRAMLCNYTNNEENVMHCIFKFIPSEKLNENLRVIKEFLSDDEFFVQLLLSRNESSMTMFHFASCNEKLMDLSFLSEYLSESEITDLLMQTDKDGETFLHNSARNNLNNLPRFLEFSHKMLMNDTGRFEDLILMQNNLGNTFLREFASSESERECIREIFDTLRQALSDEVFAKIVKT